MKQDTKTRTIEMSSGDYAVKWIDAEQAFTLYAVVREDGMMAHEAMLLAMCPKLIEESDEFCEMLVRILESMGLELTERRVQ